MSTRFQILLVLLAATLVVVPSAVNGQGQPDDFGRFVGSLEDAFGRSDADAVLGYAGGRIDLAIEGGARQYSRAQAKYVLRSFLESNPVHSFALVVNTSNQKGRFLEGTMRAGKANYDVFVWVRNRSGSWEVREIIFQKRKR